MGGGLPDESDGCRVSGVVHYALPEIPTARSRRVQHSVRCLLYALRNCIERRSTV